ncbi:YihY/virulence factor BrkB family protein [Rhodopseudomonas palustris]|uniref:YihY/virulence factor BrkB family protein n=1 Tax=Rhodopseudomonas palustris TaxID=1076 RepID=UPI0020CDE8C5|nr:YihY/virulence factor BrkB family protein [Rhodopseudomonas palustris]MCP9626163.1 YihY/virulence factor BrkB family protein [Rhodopseudomonas palustris]
MSDYQVTSSARGSRLQGMSLGRVALVVAFSVVANRLLPPSAETRGRRRGLPAADRQIGREGQNDQFESPADDPQTAAPEHGDRGRTASAPSEIPARGWKDILLRVVQNFSAHRIMSLAAGMTYYSLLAIFPALAALVAIYGVFSDASSITKHLDQFSGFLPGGAIDVARDQLTRVASKGAETLGFTFVIGLVISLWSANAAVKSLFDTLNIVYREEEKRSFIKLNAISLGFTLGGIVLAVAALTSIVIVPVVLEWVGLSSFGDLLLRIGRWPLMLLVLALALAVVYRYGPSREAPRWRWISWGSGIAAVAWLLASGLFSFYAANFGNFNETYGSLGAVIGFMTWLWISAIVILLGAELDAEMEHQTARDTTTGHPRPIGTRGARVADSVGPAQG